MNVTRIDKLDIDELQPYRTLRRSMDHQREGIFVAEGKKVVRRLLESDITTLSLLITPEWFDIYKSMLEKRSDNPHVYLAEKELLEKIVGFNLHQGIMAVGKIPSPEHLEAVLSSSTRPRLFVAVDGLTNSENLGVLVRNCVAFGVQGILVGETSSSPYLRRAVRNSIGTVFKIPVVHLESLRRTLKELRERYQIRCIAAHPQAKSLELYSTDFTGDCCVVLGSEGEGISEEVLTVCDEAVAIPMQPEVDSLNVASAGAVLLYEVMRQRSFA